MTFIEKCVNGAAHHEEIDDYVDLWHDSDSNDELFEFLGMTEQEYETWLRHPEKLPQIISVHKNKVQTQL